MPITSNGHTITVSGDILENTAADFMAIFYTMNSKEININVVMSDGGSLNAAMALYDFIAMYRRQGYVFTTYAFGHIFSASTIIWMAGNHRYFGKNTQIIIHEPSSSTCDDSASRESLLTKLRSVTMSTDRMVEIYTCGDPSKGSLIRGYMHNSQALTIDEIVASGMGELIP